MEIMKSFFMSRDEHLGAYLFVALLSGALGLPQPVQATEFTCASGDVTCLIDAINQANANGQTNKITLRRGTYTLTADDNTTEGSPSERNGLPSITSTLTLRGACPDTTKIERVASDQCTCADNLALDDRGGGIFNSPSGALLLTDSTLTGNVAAGAGGGIWNGGALVVINSTLVGRSAFAGGGLGNFGGTATFLN